MHWYIKHKKEAFCCTADDPTPVASTSRSADESSGFALFTWADGHTWLSSEPALNAMEDKVLKKPSSSIQKVKKSSPLKIATSRAYHQARSSYIKAAKDAGRRVDKKAANKACRDAAKRAKAALGF